MEDLSAICYILKEDSLFASLCSLQAEAGGEQLAIDLAKRQRLDDEAMQADTVEQFPEFKETAYMHCSRTGAHNLQTTSIPLSLVGLHGFSRELAHRSISDKCWENTASLLQKQPELSKLPQVDVTGTEVCLIRWIV
jgi:hypothetical protein